jgi:hypothetical protein
MFEQAHVPPLGQVAVQFAQTPLAPQAVTELPAMQVPATVAEQHPLLHASLDVQEDEHSPLEPHASSAVRQSPATMQPHSPLARHAVPPELLSHGTQVLPAVPQAPCCVPVAQLPALQQPPWHGCSGEHAVVH